MKANDQLPLKVLTKISAKAQFAGANNHYDPAMARFFFTHPTPLSHCHPTAIPSLMDTKIKFVSLQFHLNFVPLSFLSTWNGRFEWRLQKKMFAFLGNILLLALVTATVLAKHCTTASAQVLSSSDVLISTSPAVYCMS